MGNDTLLLLQPFLIALFLGALLGFERSFALRFDREVSDFLGGIRTYALVSLCGSLVSFLADRYLPELLAIGFAGIIVLAAISYYVGFSKHNEGGITTEISIFLCFLVGVTVQKNHLVLALFITITAAVILHLKDYLHRITARVEAEDIRATLKFAIITFIILIFDPDYTFYMKDFGALLGGLFETVPGIAGVKVINPYTVWIMVVLISAIGFSGYIAIKIMGSRKGIGLTGFLGGLASSTATTITFSKRSRDAGGATISLSYAMAVLLACTTMFPRVIVEVFIINASLVPKLAVTMGMMAAAGFTVCAVIWKKSGSEKGDDIHPRNPFNILPAVTFGLIYAAIVFIARIVEVLAGDSGIYAISVLAGLSDVDPITLTMSQISREDPSKLDQASIAITLAVFSNTVMKAGLAAFLGSKRFRTAVLIGFGIILVAGAAGLVLLRML